MNPTPEEILCSLVPLDSVRQAISRLYGQAEGLEAEINTARYELLRFWIERILLAVNVFGPGKVLILDKAFRPVIAEDAPSRTWTHLEDEVEATLLREAALDEAALEVASLEFASAALRHVQTSGRLEIYDSVWVQLDASGLMVVKTEEPCALF